MTERTDSPAPSGSVEAGGLTEAAPVVAGGLVVAAAIVRRGRDGAVELFGARRKSPESLAGQWELPGGKVEPDEDPEEALHRELAEELGIRVRLLDRLHGPDGGDWPIPGSARRLRIWLADLHGDSPEPHVRDDHDEASWFTPSTVTSVPWLAADLPPATALLNDPHLRSLFGSRDPYRA
jgi:8-oxo-dGTP diphosphatase